jgi:hypothetical protein
MEIPSQKIKKLKSLFSETRIIRDSEEWFLTNYYSKNSKNINLKFEIGKMYCFHYNNPKSKEQLKYYNALPVGICIGYVMQGKGNIDHPLMIGLHFLPQRQRLIILDKLAKLFANGAINQNAKTVIKKGNIKKIVSVWYKIVKKMLIGTGFNYAIRSYIPKRIQSLPMIIEPNDWYRIGLFDSKFIIKTNQKTDTKKKKEIVIKKTKFKDFKARLINEKELKHGKFKK